MTPPGQTTAAMDEGRANAILHSIANGFRDQIRAPLLRTPADAGLTFQDITFPSEDGVPLEGWFIEKRGSDRLLILNHPRGFNRAGCPSHLEPWRSIGAMGGNDFEVDFIPDLRILHDAGYNLLTYDLRNHGQSGSGNGGLVTSGRFESRDVVGSVDYVRSRADLRTMAIGLFSRCMGCNATILAMDRRPDVFDGVRCLIGVQPVSPRVIMARILDLVGVGSDQIDHLAERIRLVTSFVLDDLSPIPAARAVRVPTYLYQVRDDVMTQPSDVQAMFDAVAAADKELFWIDGTTRRWEGYTYFARHPDKILRWLGARMRT